MQAPPQAFDQTWLWWLPALPLLGSVLCGLLHFATLRARRAQGGAERAGPSALAPLVACGAMLAAFALAVAATLRIGGETVALESPAWSWIDTGGFAIDVSIVVDRLSAVMTLVITGVGFLIHVYAAGYMKGDPGYAKFFAYLNLFVFAMLLLVLSSSLVGLFVGWEGVGLCSYLLIGFWYEKGWPAEAGQKAFVMNRVGDACFLLGAFLLARSFGTLDLSTIAAAIEGRAAAGPEALLELLLAGLLLFGGACGKSAQIPLFTWLPDAMAGPTPVSALIHAATMVTAGVYLCVRLNPLFAAVPELMLVVAAVGAVTALVAGSSALFQRDIKKVLAYSTVSQLGYMFLGVGTGAFAAAIFHLVTHAFFKALLFLGAGSVIHGLHQEQDLHRMGGLRRHMPRTFVTFLAGAAALSGLPLLSGYFSKDEILAHAYAGGGALRFLWGIGIVTAALTAFYTWRMVALTFFGRERFDPHHVHPHESPTVMTAPLAILAVLSVLGGLLGLPPVLHVTHLLEHWLAPVTAPGLRLLDERGALHVLDHGPEWVLLGVGALIALVCAHVGFRTYARDGAAPDVGLARARPGLVRFLQGAWGVDAAYTSFVVEPLKKGFLVLSVLVDGLVVDGLVNGAGALARESGARLRRMATGQIATYGLWMGAAAALLVWLLVRGIG